ncbi:MAG TPA: hypothetical protein VFY39_00720, partial [Gammaproteobacteria bacterium]|nr:hypothetical protein [Gammaproteobacteria bacterium]
MPETQQERQAGKAVRALRGKSCITRSALAFGLRAQPQNENQGDDERHETMSMAFDLEARTLADLPLQDASLDIWDS